MAKLAIPSRFCPVYHALRCVTCDAGDDPAITSILAAEMLGWECIDCDHDGLSWNHLGICPDCAQEEEEAANAP